MERVSLVETFKSELLIQKIMAFALSLQELKLSTKTKLNEVAMK